MRVRVPPRLLYLTTASIKLVLHEGGNIIRDLWIVLRSAKVRDSSELIRSVGVMHQMDVQRMCLLPGGELHVGSTAE